MKVYLCGKNGCCPSVEVLNDQILIGEDDNTCILSREQWNDLVDKVKTGTLQKI